VSSGGEPHSPAPTESSAATTTIAPRAFIPVRVDFIEG
jgi:hypothetical protein